jgi:predicted transcriptional regulator
MAKKREKQPPKVKPIRAENRLPGYHPSEKLIVDAKTGRVDGRYVEGQDKPPGPDDWVRIIMGGAGYLAGNDALSADMRVFCALLQNVQFGNYTCIKHTEMAEHLGVSTDSVSRSLAKFVRIGLIQRIKVHGTIGYRFNPNIAHRGYAHDIPTAVAIWHAERARTWEKRKAREEAQQYEIAESVKSA